MFSFVEIDCIGDLIMQDDDRISTSFVCFLIRFGRKLEEEIEFFEFSFGGNSLVKDSILRELKRIETATRDKIAFRKGEEL